MPDNNRISAEFSAEQIASVNNAIVALRDALPFLVSLVPDERRKLPKLGPKTLGFDERCQAHMASHPELVPSFIDQAEIAKDRALRERMTGVVRDLVNLATSAEDTLLLISHEVYSADLAFYQNVRQAAKRGILNAQTILDDLSPRFPGRSSARAESGKTPAIATA